MPSVSGEVGNVGALLQVPDLDHTISSSRSKYQPIRVKLGTSESRASSRVCALADDLPTPEVGEGPVLVKRGAQQVVPSGVQTDASHCIAVSLGVGGRGGDMSRRI